VRRTTPPSPCFTMGGGLRRHREFIHSTRFHGLRTRDELSSRYTHAHSSWRRRAFLSFMRNADIPLPSPFRCDLRPGGFFFFFPSSRFRRSEFTMSLKHPHGFPAGSSRMCVVRYEQHRPGGLQARGCTLPYMLHLLLTLASWCGAAAAAAVVIRGLKPFCWGARGGGGGGGGG